MLEDNNMGNNLEQLTKQHEDRVVAYNASVWSHLITINSFVISLYSLLIGIKENIPNFISFYIFPFSLFFALLSITLLLSNFVSSRNAFLLMGEHSRIKDKEKSVQFFKNNINKIKKAHSTVKWYEHMAKWTFIGNFIIIFVIIAWP